MNNISISEFYYEDDCPYLCSCCPDELNGIYYGHIVIGKMKIKINLCEECLNKLKKEFTKDE